MTSWSPAALGASWRRIVGDWIWEAVPHTWIAAYDRDARKSLDQVLSRLQDGMTQAGRVPFAECGKDGVLSLVYISPDQLKQRGDRRYGSDRLAEFLRANPQRDLVPIIVGAGQVLDGHHRFRAYAMVGRSALSFRGDLRSGTGLVCFSETPATSAP